MVFWRPAEGTIPRVFDTSKRCFTRHTW
jgi:hypothetical protein